ncbi:MAG: DinB family protein [Holophagaceae bacterium]|nr:DinB family protein [Holophagaceae bacterium]
MTTPDNLRKHLAALLNWQDAHVDFDTAVKGLPPRLRGVQPQGLPYSAWQLLEHLRLGQRDILDFCVDPAYRAPKWPEAYWPKSPVPPTPKAWQQSIAAVRADRRSLEKLLADPALDLFAKIPHGEGQTYLREFLLVADHNAFHVGQLIILRRLLGAWK